MQNEEGLPIKDSAHRSTLLPEIDPEIISRLKGGGIGEKHYKRQLTVFMEELESAGESPLLITSIVRAYDKARIVSTGQIEKEFMDFKKESPIFDPEVPDDEQIDMGPFKVEPHIVSTKNPEEYAKLLMYSNLIYNLFETGMVGDRIYIEKVMEDEASHEFEHAAHFSNDPEADIRFSALFFLEKDVGMRIMYPGIMPFGKIKAGSYRGCFDVEDPSPLDQIFLD